MKTNVILTPIVYSCQILDFKNMFKIKNLLLLSYKTHKINWKYLILRALSFRNIFVQIDRFFYHFYYFHPEYFINVL